MIPDFESFIRFDDDKLYSHTWAGIFWYDLPLGIVFLFIFHYMVRDALICNLPESLSKRFMGYIGFKWWPYFKKNFLLIIASLLVGILSHFLWDAFTHLNLANPHSITSKIYVGRIRLYKMLQYSNSLIGLAVIIWFLKRLPKHNEVKPTEPAGNMKMQLQPVKEKGSGKVKYWTIAAIITITTIVMSILIIGFPIDVILFIDLSISGSLLALILTPLFCRLIPGMH